MYTSAGKDVSPLKLKQNKIEIPPPPAQAALFSSVLELHLFRNYGCQIWTQLRVEFISTTHKQEKHRGETHLLFLLHRLLFRL